MALAATGTDARAQVRSKQAARPVTVAQGPGPIHRGKFKPHTVNSPFMGELTKPIEQYSGQELHELAQRSTWFGWERERQCSHKFDVCKTTDAARLQIQAIGDANKFPITSPADSFPNGVVIGVLRNVGNYRDSITQVPGDEAIPSDYFFVVLPNGGQVAGLKIARVTYVQQGADTVPEAYVKIDTSKTGITPCADGTNHAGGPHHRTRNYPIADFATCAMPTPPDTLYPEGTLRPAGRHEPGKRNKHKKYFLATSSDATPWFSCNEGCCSTQSPP